MRWLGRGEGGQALVEFALTLFPFLLVVFGIIDGGLATYSYVTVGNAAREGARIGIVSSATDAEIQSAVNLHGGMLHLTSTNTTISPATTRTSGGTVTVTVSYTYVPKTPLAGPLIGNITLSSSAKMNVE